MPMWASFGLIWRAISFRRDTPAHFARGAMRIGQPPEPVYHAFRRAEPVDQWRNAHAGLGCRWQGAVSWRLMPNLFPLFLQQLKDGGISFFMHHLGPGYANYINRKYEERSGHLFQGRFKAKQR